MTELRVANCMMPYHEGGGRRHFIYLGLRARHTLRVAHVATALQLCDLVRAQAVAAATGPFAPVLVGFGYGVRLQVGGVVAEGSRYLRRAALIAVFLV